MIPLVIILCTLVLAGVVFYTGRKLCKVVESLSFLPVAGISRREVFTRDTSEDRPVDLDIPAIVPDVDLSGLDIESNLVPEENITLQKGMGETVKALKQQKDKE